MCGFDSGILSVGIRGVVIVGPYSLGDAPIGHCEFRIEFRGVLKRPRRLVVIEGINKAQALVEELLRLRIAGGNRVVKIAQVRHLSDGVGLRVGGMILGSRTQAKRGTAQHLRQNFHLGQPS